MSSSRKKFIKRAKKVSKPFIQDSIRSGAENVGKQLLDAMSNTNSTSNSVLGKLIDAVKGGVFATGQEMMQKGFDRMKVPGMQNNTTKVSE